MTWPV